MKNRFEQEFKLVDGVYKINLSKEVYSIYFNNIYDQMSGLYNINLYDGTLSSFLNGSVTYTINDFKIKFGRINFKISKKLYFHENIIYK